MITCMTNYLKIHLLWRQKGVRIHYSMQERSEDCALSVSLLPVCQAPLEPRQCFFTKQSRNGKKRGSKSPSWKALWEDWTLKCSFSNDSNWTFLMISEQAFWVFPSLLSWVSRHHWNASVMAVFVARPCSNFHWVSGEDLSGFSHEPVHGLCCQYSRSVFFLACDGTRNNLRKTRLDYGSICKVSKNCHSWKPWESRDTWVRNGKSHPAYIKFGALLLLKLASTENGICVLRETLIPESGNIR